MLYRQLGATGLQTSILGFGASPLGDVFRKVNSDDAVDAVHVAIDAGINFFDVSPYYGLTLAETRLGRALGSRRKDILLSTKCGRYGADEFDFSAAHIRAGLEASLERLQTDYVDILLAHDVEFAEPRQIVEETLPAMRAMQQAGKARFIGISGLPLDTLQNIAQQTPLDVILSYCHYNPLDVELKKKLLPFAIERNIGLINASPLHMGLLHGDEAPGWHPAPESVKKAAAQFVMACRNRNLNPVAVALRFALEDPDIATTLVGISNLTEVNQNLEALDLKIDPELRAEIARIAAPISGITWTSGRVRNGKSEVHA